MTAESTVKSAFDAVIEEIRRNPGFSGRLESALHHRAGEVQKIKGVTEDCVEFVDAERNVAINVAPMFAVRFVPRSGETVFLPGEEGSGSGTYKVRNVTYYYRENPDADGPCPAKPLKITVAVRKLATRSSRRGPAVLDPFALYAEGKDVLRRRLEVLDIERLKDIVAEHGMDSPKLAMKWKTRGRLMELIIKTVSDRAHKGDAFRSSNRT